MKRGVPIAFLLLAVAPAAAQEVDYRDARIVLAEPGAMLHGASEADAEQAVPNLPWLPGDRVWTESGARMEIQFADGTLVQLAEDSKLDYEASDMDRGTAVLRLWTGSLYLIARGRSSSPGFEIETESGVVYVSEAADVRVDAIPGETRLSVFRGSAQLSGGGETVNVYPGERSYASFGSAAEAPHRFDHQAADAFDSWSRSRRDRYAAVAAPPGMPEEIEPYAAELEEHGSWAVVAEVGHVWRPRVAVSWTPYSHGRWVPSAYGWVWVASEPWGWAPSHYGRWGHSLDLGWYWIPGRRWSGAWVSWRVGGGYVGWSALGRHGRPVHYVSHRGHGGYPRHGWTYARHTGLGARHLSRHLVHEDRIPRQRLSQLAGYSQPDGGRRAVSRWSRTDRDRSDRFRIGGSSLSPRADRGRAGTAGDRFTRSGSSRRAPQRSGDPSLEALRRMRSGPAQGRRSPELQEGRGAERPRGFDRSGSRSPRTRDAAPGSVRERSPGFGASSRSPRRSGDPGLEALRQMRSGRGRDDGARAQDPGRGSPRLERAPERGARPGRLTAPRREASEGRPSASLRSPSRRSETRPSARSDSQPSRRDDGRSDERRGARRRERDRE
jgi:hypothetical protein